MKQKNFRRRQPKPETLTPSDLAAAGWRIEPHPDGGYQGVRDDGLMTAIFEQPERAVLFVRMLHGRPT